MKTPFVALLPLALGLASCVAVMPAGAGSGPVSSAPAAGPIDRNTAERIALRVAAERGYVQTRVDKSHHDEGHGGRWKIEIRGLADGRDDRIDVRVADDGKVLDVKDHRKKDKNGKHDDDDDDKKEKKDKHDKDDGND